MSETENKKIKPQLTMETKKYLILRDKLNKKRPRFIQMNSWYLARLSDGWKKPKTLDNKIRLQIKGYPAKVKIGYRGPKKVRGYHPSGFKEVLVHNPKELEKVDPKTEAIRIAKAVGRRKRAEILKKAEELGIKVLNIGG